jgi:ATP-dependent DNA helicase RecG
MLREPHGPMPRNPLIAEPLFRVEYVEKAGTGTTDMISECLGAGLPEPVFQQHGLFFVATIWRDWLTDEVMAGLRLNERQRIAVLHVRRIGRITNSEYQRVTGASRPTAKRDLEEMVLKGLVAPGGAGRGAYYTLSAKRLKNGSNGSFDGKPKNGS